MAKRNRRGRKHQKANATNPQLNKNTGEDADMLIRYVGACEKCKAHVGIETWNAGEVVFQPCNNCGMITKCEVQLMEVMLAQ